MSVTTSATPSIVLGRREPVIGVYRRSAGCGAPRASGVRRRPRPNYALRRRAVAVGAVLVLAVAVVVLSSLLAGLGGDPAVAAETPSASSHGEATAVHVARSGDTLWSIAHAHRGDVAHERYVDALVRLNGGASIVVGQAVRLP